MYLELGCIRSKFVFRMRVHLELGCIKSKCVLKVRVRVVFRVGVYLE